MELDGPAVLQKLTIGWKHEPMRENLEALATEGQT